MKKLSSSLFAFLACATLWAQSPVQGKLSAPDTATLKVIRIAADSFPNVSVFFKAETKEGKPLWNLRASDLSVTEDGKPCQVVRLEKVSKTRSVKVVLVVDHSGSMASDYRLTQWYASLDPDTFRKDSAQFNHTTYKYDENLAIIDSIPAGNWVTSPVIPPPPAWYKPPMFYARQGVTSFIRSIDTRKDSFAIVGFDDDVDYRLRLTNDTVRAKALMRRMEPEASTAFYDAVMVALKQLRDEPDKQLCAIIALTDGQDNSSKYGLNRVIREATGLDVPVYVIGLGDVNKHPLRKLGRKTGGDCYFTNNPKQLGEIYLTISRRVQSVYELVYASPSLASADTTRDVMLSFTIDSLFLEENQLRVLLPPEVVLRLKEKEKADADAQAAAQQAVASPPDENNFPVTTAVIIVVAAAGAGILIARARKNPKKKQDTLLITNIFPNPASGPLTVQFTNNDSSTPADLIISDMNGVELIRVPASGVSVQLDLGQFSSGTYLVMLQGSATASPVKQLVISK